MDEPHFQEQPDTVSEDKQHHKQESKDPAKNLHSTSPESLFLMCDGEFSLSSSFAQLNVSVLDLCNFNKLAWKQRFRIVATRITETQDRAFTSFDQACIMQMLYLLICAHNETYFPRSTHRPDIENLYKRLARMLGKLELVEEEIELFEACIMHETTAIYGAPQMIGSFLPDTPGIIVADNTCYDSNITSAFYFTPFKLLFDHYVINVRSANQSLQPLPNAPPTYPTSFPIRGQSIEGIGRAATGSNLELIDVAYVPHQPVPNIADTWEVFTFPEVPAVRQWMASLVPCRNRITSSAKLGTGIHIEKILGKGPSLESLKSSDIICTVQTTIDDIAAQPAVGPTTADMNTLYRSDSSIILSKETITKGALYAPNPYFGNRKPAASNIGSFLPAPLINGAARHLNTNPRAPIPAWAGPIQIGPIFSTPLISTRAMYDRTLVGSMDST